MALTAELPNTRTLTLQTNGGVVQPVVGVGPQGAPGPGSAAWTALEAVTAATVRQAPDGSYIRATTSRTTRATFDATEQGFWAPVLATAGTLENLALLASFAGIASVPTDLTSTSADGALTIGKANRVDASTGARTMTLADGAAKGQITYAEKYDSSVNTVTLTGKIRSTSAGSFVLSYQYETIGLVWMGTFWEPLPGHRTKASIAKQMLDREATPKLYHLDSYAAFFRSPTYVFVTGQGATATTASADAAAGDLTLTVASVTGLSAGVVVITGAGTAQMQQRSVVSVAGSVLTLDAVLTYPVPHDAAVSPLWTNDRHLTHAGYTAFGYFIANAKDASGNYIITGTTPKVTYLCNSWVDQDGPAYGDTLHARIPGAVFVDAGVSGDESDLLLARFDTDVPSDSNYVVVNEPGVNDTAGTYSLATMAANLEALWHKTQAIGATLIYTGLVPLQPYPTVSAARAASMRTMLGDASAFPKVTNIAYAALAVDLAAAPSKVPNASSVGVGSGALNANPTGTALTALGFNAGFVFTTGSSSTAVGYAALAAATTSTGNTAIGTLALRFATTSFNTAVGTNALSAMTTGTGTALGYNAGLHVTTGINNVAVGYAALSAVTIENNNVAVGTLALAAATASNNVAVGSNALAVNTTGASNTAVGAFALTAVVDATAVTAMGHNAGLHITSGSSNTAIGYSALGEVTTQANNTAVGSLALRNAVSASNTAVGSSALTAVNSGAGNSALGHNAGLAVTTGGNNTMMGYASLAAASTAASNTAFGSLALTLATGSFNTAMGHNAGTAQTTGAGNVVIGYEAGHLAGSGLNTNQTTTQSNQTIVGRQAGGNADTITAIGYLALASATGATALGAGTVASAAGAVAIGRDNAGTGASATVANHIALGTALHQIDVLGRVNTAASTTTQAGIVVPHGTAPTSPTDGAIWTTTAGMFVRINGVTKTVTLT